MARKQATFIAGTGYQYGDTDFIEYSERFYRNFVRELRAGPAMSASATRWSAKQDYLRPRKTCAGCTRRRCSNRRCSASRCSPSTCPTGCRAAPRLIVGATGDYGTDRAYPWAPPCRGDDQPDPLGPHKTLTNVGGLPATLAARWYSGSNGVVTHQNEPALPLEARNVSVQDKTLRGVLWLGGAYTDDSVVPLTGAPATENRGVHTRFASPVLYPDPSVVTELHRCARTGGWVHAVPRHPGPAQGLADPGCRDPDDVRTHGLQAVLQLVRRSSGPLGRT